jgi:hypothetical protein
MSEFNISLWKKALSIWKRSELDGVTLGRESLAKLMNISDRQSGQLLFALKNRNVINCANESYSVESADIELAFGDVHIPFHDEAAIDIMLDEAERANVNIITINGDLLDFYQISTFTKNPKTGKSPFGEIEQASEWLSVLRSRFPDARIIFLQGNHEFRMEKYICDKAPAIADLVEGLLIDKLRLRELKIEYKTEPYRIGNLWHLHGHERPGGSYNPEYITNVMMGYIFDHYIVFHYHRTQDKVFRRLGDRWFKAAAVGYLAQTLDYAQTNKWNQGFAIIRYRENGDFTIDNKVIIRGEVY